MYERIIYGSHTADYKHRIGLHEAERLKLLLVHNVTDNLYKYTGFHMCGIEEMTIMKQSAPEGRCKYELHLRINHSKIIGNDGNAIMKLSKDSINLMINIVDYFLKNVLKLEGQYGNDDFTKWSIERFDDAFDLYLEDDPRGYIYLMNQSLYLPLRSKFSVYDEKGLLPYSKRASESVYFYNKSYRINAYSKEHEVLNKHPDYEVNDVIHNLLRIERQSEQQYVKKYFPNRLVSDLKDERNIESMRQGLKDSIKEFWGTDDYFEIDYIKDEVSSYEENGDYSHSGLLNQDVLSGGRLLLHKNLDEKTRATFKKLGIAPAFVDFSVGDKCGYFTDDGSSDGQLRYCSFPSIYGLIDEVFPDIKRRNAYHSFAVPHYDTKRRDWRVSMTVHKHSTEKGIPDCANGRTFELCQERMFKKLVNHFNQNLVNGQDNEGIIQDMEMFKKTIKTAELKRQVKDYIDEHTKSGSNWSK